MGSSIPVVEIKANLQWHCRRDPASGWWLADCDALNLTAGEETWRELLKSIEQGLDMLFQGLLEEGKLDEFLAQHGWTPKTPIPASGQQATFDVPFELSMSRSDGSARPLSR